jgi:thiamine-phosphate pyrophosphorylase
MASHPLLYYITDRSQFSGSEDERRRLLLARIADAARHTIDLIQLREKDLSAKELEALARAALAAIRDHRNENAGVSTRLLINSRLDVAMAVGASGVHLRSDDISVVDGRAVLTAVRFDRPFTIARSCHTLAEVRQAATEQAEFVVFGPVFAKKDSVTPMNPDVSGLNGLAEASVQGIPVLALGGVTLDNAARCIQAGAAGIAGIRLFQQGSIAKVVEQLRGIK